MNIGDKTVSQSAYRLHLIFIQHITTTELATITSTPRKDHSLLIDCCSMVIAKSQFCYLVAFELDNLPRHRLLEDISVAQSAKVSVAPGVDDSVLGHCA